MTLFWAALAIVLLAGGVAALIICRKIDRLERYILGFDGRLEQYTNATMEVAHLQEQERRRSA